MNTGVVSIKLAFQLASKQAITNVIVISVKNKYSHSKSYILGVIRLPLSDDMSACVERQSWLEQSLSRPVRVYTTDNSTVKCRL